MVPTQSYQQALGLGKPFLERSRDFFSSLQINRYWSNNYYYVRYIYVLKLHWYCCHHVFFPHVLPPFQAYLDTWTWDEVWSFCFMSHELLLEFAALFHTVLFVGLWLHLSDLTRLSFSLLSLWSVHQIYYLYNLCYHIILHLSNLSLKRILKFLPFMGFVLPHL